MNKEEIIDKIAKMECEIKNLKEELNKQEEPKKSRWKPVLGERHWFIDNDGDIYCMPWNDSIVYNNRYELGNVFKTKEEAEFALEQLKILAQIKQYADDDKEWNGINTHWNITYDTNDGCIEVGNYCKFIVSPFNLYFSSKEQAQKAIDAIGEERLKKYYFCVEE